MEATDKMSHMKNPVPMVERLAYVVKEYEESHAGWAAQVVNGRSVDDAGNELPLVKTECECQRCKDARLVLADYDAGVR